MTTTENNNDTIELELAIQRTKASIDAQTVWLATVAILLFGIFLCSLFMIWAIYSR